MDTICDVVGGGVGGGSLAGSGGVLPDSVPVSELVGALVRSEGLQGAMRRLGEMAVLSGDAGDRELGYVVRDWFAEQEEGGAA